MSKFGDYEVTEAMIRYGGSFVAGLGKLYRLADAQNQATLRSAFADYFAEYHGLALRADIDRASEWLAETSAKGK